MEQNNKTDWEFIACLLFILAILLMASCATPKAADRPPCKVQAKVIRVADFRLDFAESAEATAINVIKKATE
jgi:hypothetical protein